jgi:hypothetical protein
MIRDAFQGPFIRSIESAEISWLEGMFSRVDRRLLYPLIRAGKGGQDLMHGANFKIWPQEGVLHEHRLTGILSVIAAAVWMRSSPGDPSRQVFH